MTLSEFDISTAKAPLVLAVTGHRDLREQDLDVLTQAVTRVLRDLRKKFPSTPFILLSPLAEGADRLVARVALLPEMKTRLVVPLPMPIDLYEDDFPSSKEEFRDLLSRAYAAFEAHPPSDLQAVAVPGRARDLRYEAVGRYIVRECQILLALWDGAESDKVGGTATVVQFQTQGLPEHISGNLLPPELFPVYHILTPRRSKPCPPGEPGKMKELYPQAFIQEGKAEDYYAKLFGNLEEFNRHIDQGGATLAEEAAKSKKDLAGDLCSLVLTANEELDLTRYAVADALALRFQRKVAHTHSALVWSVFGAFLFFVLFAHLPKHPPLLLFLSFAMLAVGLIAQRRAKRLDLDNKSQDYRAVGEGCRVKFFWRIAGIRDQVSDNYLGKQRTELDWIRNGLRGWDIGAEESAAISRTMADIRLRFVLRRWVNGQLDYFTGKAKSQHDESHKVELRVTQCLQLAIGVGAAVLFANVLLQVLRAEWWACVGCEDWLHHPVILIDILLAAGALLHHGMQQRALVQHIKQYKRVKSIFQNASRLVQNSLPNHVDEARHWLRKLGQEALAENGDWVLLHRERPLELPHP